MVPGVVVLLVLLALGLTILAALRKIEPWVPLFIVCLILLVQVWPR